MKKGIVPTYMLAIVIAIIVILLIWLVYTTVLGSGETVGANIAQKLKDILPFL